MAIGTIFSFHFKKFTGIYSTSSYMEQSTTFEEMKEKLFSHHIFKKFKTSLLYQVWNV